MKRCSVVAFSLPFALLAHGHAYAQAAENAVLQLEVSPQTGSIVRLKDKRSGMEYITDATQARLFELMIPDATNYSRRIVSYKNEPASVRSLPGQIEIRYTQLRPDEEQYRFGSGLMHFAEPMLDIEAVVTLRLDADHLEASLRLVNRSLTTITGVAFPYVGGLATQSAEGDAQVVLPSTSQRVFRSTLGALSGQRALRYPGMLASSWLNYGWAGKGLGLEVRSGLDSQDAYFALSPGPFLEGSAYRGRYEYPFIAWIHYPHVPGRGEWTSPPAILHVHGTDWHGMAAEHREWFRASSKPRAAHTWREDLGLATYLLKSDDNTILWKYSQLHALAATAAEAGLRRIVVDGWRQQEGPGNPSPFGEIADPRLGGASSIRKTIAQLQDAGTQLLFTFHPTVLNATQGRIAPQIGLWAVKTRRQGNQLPVDFLYHTFDYPDSVELPNYRVEIDPASPALAVLAKDAKRLNEEYGFRNLILKGVGQQAFLSYNRHHGLPPQQVYASGYPRLLAELRKTYGNGMLVTEGLNDLVNPHADGAYTWDQSQDTAVLAYSLPWVKFSSDVEALDYAAANSAFAHGALANAIVDGGQGTVADYPLFARHLRALRNLKLATAPYYADAEFRDHDGQADVKNDYGVLSASFVNPAGAKRGIVVANLTDQPGTARFQIEGLTSMSRLQIFPSSGKALDASGLVAMSLAAHEVVVIAIDAEPAPERILARQ